MTESLKRWQDAFEAFRLAARETKQHELQTNEWECTVRIYQDFDVILRRKLLTEPQD